jgi:hypothetical protein
VNRSEIEQEIITLRKKVEVMNKDLEKFAVELSATSQVAIIARVVLLESDIKDYEAMLDTLKFEEIVGGEF